MTKILTRCLPTLVLGYCYVTGKRSITLPIIFHIHLWPSAHIHSLQINITLTQFQLIYFNNYKMCNSVAFLEDCRTTVMYMQIQCLGTHAIRQKPVKLRTYLLNGCPSCHQPRACLLLCCVLPYCHACQPFLIEGFMQLSVKSHWLKC